MNKKRFAIIAALLLCLSLTACNQNVDLTEDPSLSSSVSGSAGASDEPAEGTQLTSAQGTSQTAATVSQTTGTQDTETTAVTVSTEETTPKESQAATAAATVTTTTTTTTTTTAAPAPAPVITTTTTAAPVVTTTTTQAPPVTTTTTAPPVTTTTKSIDDFVDLYNMRLQEQQEKDFCERVFELTNQFREENGKTAFKRMDALDKAAVVRAWEILYDYRSDHKRPDGRSYGTVFEDFGIDCNGWAENIAAGQDSPEAVVEAWKNSEGHRKNMLSDDYTYMGVGMYYSPDAKYKYYWTQDFCGF
ncbi:MAG: CAP domain-containing protein [Ruminococcaceae bacterium]|nr:CAP domain-containing protein [Oscillospiraceae bacterium]